MSNADKIILDLCGGTGAWSKPYKDAGYDVRLITLPENDVRLFKFTENIYGILAAPVCTHYSNAGAKFFKVKGDTALLESNSILDACCRIILFSNPVFWAIENPIGRISNYIGKSIFKFDPFEFAGYADKPNDEAYTKKTQLWGKFNLPVKKPVECLYKSHGKTPNTWYNKVGGKSEETKQYRSITPSGFARAFFEANQ